MTFNRVVAIAVLVIVIGCKTQQETLMHSTYTQKPCIQISIPESYRFEIIVNEIFWQKGDSVIYFEPLTIGSDTIPLRARLTNQFIFPEMCNEFDSPQYLICQISKDSTGRFNQFQIVKGGPCNVYAGKELKRILNHYPVLIQDFEGDDFFLPIKFINRN